MQSKYIETNKNLWDTWTKLNVVSEYYDVEKFKSTCDSLNEIELEELGDISGKSMLHLMCHFGLDSLSWAKRGAKVTGVDLSEEAIKFAKSLNNELDMEARFICSDIFDLPNKLDEKFDIVFLSYGVLSWIPNLKRFFQIVANFMKCGSVFYLVEYHPFNTILFPRTTDDAGNILDINYFSNQPIKGEERGSYANQNVDKCHTCYTWRHSMGEIITTLVQAGLKLEYLHEFPGKEKYVYHDRPGKIDLEKIPYLFSICATRE